MRTRAPTVAGLTVTILLVACASASRAPAASGSERAIDALLAADRAFASAAERGDVIAKITAMFADDIMMPTPRQDFARNRAEAADALRAGIGAGRTRVVWGPIRGGISADGEHGFTFGYGTLSGPDTSSVPLKYLTYWVKRPDGWRAVAYRLARRPAGEVSNMLMPPSLPSRWVAPTADRAAIESHRASLVATERAFSDRAQVVGLGPAFTENGSADAVNMGGRDSPAFIVGATAIGKAVGGGSTGPGSPVSWGADKAIVASSGDLGVTFGVIRPNEPPAEAGRATGFPFFTIWRRAGPGESWRYVAE
jgi:ketosteroid isomerase-like protein